MYNFVVTPITEKEKARVRDHGDVWTETAVRHIKLPDKVLLESVKTAHVRWWRKDQVEWKQITPNNY
jgi:hypothetical protein